jgi:hypothetical protein
VRPNVVWRGLIVTFDTRAWINCCVSRDNMHTDALRSWRDLREWPRVRLRTRAAVLRPPLRRDCATRSLRALDLRRQGGRNSDDHPSNDRRDLANRLIC